MMKVFAYRKCSTCMKALKWLEVHNVEFEEMDKIYQVGEECGKEKGKYETAMKLLELGAREDMIAEAVGHSVEEIKRWKNDMKRQ